MYGVHEDYGCDVGIVVNNRGLPGTSQDVGGCWMYYFNVMCSTHVFGQRPGYLGHGELGSS